MPIKIHIDGSCRGNPGPGAWTALIEYDEHNEELSGTEEYTTGNRMELAAAVGALEHLPAGTEAEILTDSQYVATCAIGSGKPKSNLDLWQRLFFAAKQRQIKWTKIESKKNNADQNAKNHNRKLALAVTEDQNRHNRLSDPCDYKYTYEEILRANPKKAPLLDHYSWYGNHVTGTGCYFPGTEILVPGTGLFRRRSGELYVANGYRLTRNGTHYRPRIIPNLPTYMIGRIWDILTVEENDKQLAIAASRLGKKAENRYTRTMSRRSDKNQPQPKRLPRHRIKKSHQRLSKQIIREAEDNYKVSKIEAKRLSNDHKDYHRQVLDSEIGRVRKEKNIARKDGKEKQKAVCRIASKRVSEHIGVGDKTGIVILALAQAFNISPRFLAVNRTKLMRHRAIVETGKAWEHGRKKRLIKKRRPFVLEWGVRRSEVSTCCYSQASGLDAYEELLEHAIQKAGWVRRAKAPDRFGTFSRSGDLVKLEPDSNRIFAAISDHKKRLAIRRIPKGSSEIGKPEQLERRTKSGSAHRSDLHRVHPGLKNPPSRPSSSAAGASCGTAGQ